MKKILNGFIVIYLSFMMGCMQSNNKQLAYNKRGDTDKNLLGYKYILFVKYRSPNLFKKEKKIYYIQNQKEREKVIDWIKNNYPNKKHVKDCRKAVFPSCIIVFTNNLPKNYEAFITKKSIYFLIYYNLDIYGRVYFTEGQLKPLCQLFYSNENLIKLKGNPLYLWLSPPASSQK